MGIVFSRIISVFSKQFSVGTQTPWKYLDKKALGTQTSTKFTEKLTSFGTVELSSAETFDQGCNICDLYTEKEAVGFCCVCEQYMCYQCCKHHEKISLSENHKIVGKEEFETLMVRNTLFDLHAVPLMKTSLPACIDLRCGSTCYHDTALLASFSLSSSKNTYMYFLMCSISRIWYESNTLELREINKVASHKLIKSSEDNVNQNMKVTLKYFVHEKSKQIWQLEYCDNTVHYQKAFTVSGECHGVVPFDKGLAISLYIPTGFSLPDWQIQYVDFHGNIKRQIYYDSDGKALSKQPDHMTSNYSEDILFVSDNGNNAVIALCKKGRVIYKFTHDTIRYPQGITCDEENNIYVACGKDVIQIHAQGKMSRTVLNSAEYKNITNLYYYKEGKRLAVIEESKTITIFTFIPF